MINSEISHIHSWWEVWGTQGQGETLFEKFASRGQALNYIQENRNSASFSISRCSRMRITFSKKELEALKGK